jgi:septum site-determining protein MinD
VVVHHARMTRTDLPTYRVRTGRPRPTVVTVLGKGGDGKTTSTAALGDALARTGLEVALLDLDAQAASLTAWLLPDLPPDSPTVDDVLAGVAGVAEILHPYDEHLTVIPASNGLAMIEPTLRQQAFDRLLGVIAVMTQHVDVIIIDTAAIRPLGPGALLLRAALGASDVIVVPFRCSVLSLDAVEEVLQHVDAHERLSGRSVPVALLPCQTTRDGSADLVVRALILGGLRVLPGIPHSSWVVKASAARELLAERAPASAAPVLAYAEAAAELLAMVEGVRRAA